MPAKSFAIACLLGLPLGVLFAPALVGEQSLMYRDAAHYYRPLYDLVSSEWGGGRVPLWNPGEDLGKPLAGDPTAAVFYPGKLLYCLPCKAARRYHLYIFAHAWLAAGAAYLLARAWGVNRGGALLAGWAYSLSGAVLFQSVNVIFLVGAAWLPLAMLAADRALVRRCYRWALLLGAIIALILLGGDAQLAYSMGLLAVVYAVFLWRAQRAVQEEWAAAHSPALLRWRPLLLLAAAGSAVVLCSVQLVASAAWLPQTERLNAGQPANVYQAVAAAWEKGEGKGGLEPLRQLAKRPPPGTPPDNTYDFSVGPWHWAELLWPNLCGSVFPENTRWSEVIPSESRMWTPSLYLGLVPLLLAVLASRWRRKNVVTAAEFHWRWLTWLALAALLLALGRYGVGWLIEQLRLAGGGEGEPVPLADPTGGPYWLIKLFVPGYAAFRYPAKLLVFFALAASVLAGVGWQRLWGEEAVGARRQLMWLLAGVAVVSLGVYGATYPLRGWWNGWMRTVPRDSVFGPLAQDAALSQLRWALAHAVVVAFVAAGLLASAGRVSLRVAGGLLLAVCGIELTLAQRPLLEYVPSALFAEQAAFAERVLANQPEEMPARLPPRVYRGSAWAWTPPEWAEQRSRERPAEIVAWDRATLLPKYPLADDICVVAPGGSFSDARLEDLIEAARRHGHKWGAGYWEPGRSFYEVLGVGYLAVPASLTLPGEGKTRLDEGETAVAALWRLEPPLPRAWIAHEWEVAPLAEDRAKRLKQLESRYFQLGEPRWRELARLEEAPPQVDLAEELYIPREEKCIVSHYSSTRVEVSVDLAEPGLLVLAEQYAPGWEWRVKSSTLASNVDGFLEWGPSTQRVHGALRGVWLPAGNHQVVMTYRPPGFWLGLSAAVAGWLGLGGLLMISRLRRRPARPAGDIE